MKVSHTVTQRAELRGWHVISISQPAHMFPDDGRKLKRCPIKSDPWQCVIGNAANYLEATEIRHAGGATPDAAVLAAIPPDMRAALRRLEIELDNLRDCLQKLLQEEPL